MTPQEANKIIAEYMGNDSITCMIRYHESLDALVPVWEKLGADISITNSDCFKEMLVEIETDNGKYDCGWIEGTISLACCLSTCVAVQALQKIKEKV